MPEELEPFDLLIVDDDESIGAILLAILKKAGYRGKWVATGEAALGAALDYRTGGRALHAALIDLRLPDANGLDVLRGLKKLHPDVGCVIMTGYADTTTAIDALNNGASAYVQKPYNIDEIKAILGRIAERQKLVLENRELVSKLQEANAALETKVSQRTQELRHANFQLLATIDRLREADAVKSDFVAMVSHELRTPLTVIIGFSETLLRKNETIEPDQLRHNLEIIRNSSLRLARLIGDMLDLSQMQDRNIKMTWGSFNLKDLADGVVEGLKITRPDLRFELSAEGEAQKVVSDKDRVEQIFINLLGNAVKYSPQGGNVRIASKAVGSEVVISIQDEGPGIPETDLAKIFEAFFRTKDAINMKAPGTGLGLTITKAIVEALGGWIRVESGGDSRGSIFTFALPREPK